MMAQYKQIFYLYFNNTSFLFLALVLLLSAMASKFLFVFGYSVFANDVATILFVVTLWLTFYLGLLIKRQFANHRAALLPGYRAPHIYGFIFIYVFFALVAFIWDYGLHPKFQITPSGLQGVYALCFFIAVLITYLGYLSIGRVFMYAYVLGLVMAMNASQIIALFEHAVYLKYMTGLLSAVFISFFIKRLLELKEGCFEYHYLLTWPPRNYFINQLTTEQWLNPVKWFLVMKKRPVRLPSYPRTKNIVARAFHWDCIERADISTVAVLIILAAPLYLLFMKSNPVFAEFFQWSYSNFLLLSITPVLVVMGRHYKKLAYWGHDLLRPVTKQGYVLERGIVLLAHLFNYWCVFIVCFALLPNIIFQTSVFTSAKFWGFIILTGNFALLVTVWLAWLSCCSDARVVIINGLVLTVMMLFQFYFASIFSIQMIIGVNVICLGLNVLFIRKAFLAWGQKEFV